MIVTVILILSVFSGDHAFKVDSIIRIKNNICMRISFIKNQAGFSIIQGMLLAAAVAGLAYVGTRLMTDQKLAQRGAETKDKVEQIHNMIYSILQNKEHCQATFSSLPLTPGSNHTLTSITTSSGATPFRVNTTTTYDPALMYMNNTVSIRRINIAYPPDLKDLATLTMTYGRMEKDDMARRSGAGYGGQTVSRNIKIKLQRTQLGAFEGCYAVEEGQNENLIEDFCKELGATPGDLSNNDSLFEWDPVTNVCRPRDLSCPPGRIFAGFDSNGVRRCNTIEKWTDMTTLVNNTVHPHCSMADEVGFEIVGNKAKIKCVTNCDSTGWKNNGPQVCNTGSSCIPGPPITCQGTPSTPRICCDPTKCTLGATTTNVGPYGSCSGPPPACNWGSWSSWSSCSYGTQTRSRSCLPFICSGSCSGPTTESQSCTCPASDCATKRANTCYWASAGTDGCGNSCGQGTKNDSSCCTPKRVWDHYECNKPFSGMNWVNMCYYKTVCAEDPGRILSGPAWDGQAGPTSASGGDTGTRGNCHDRRRKCSLEP